MSRPPSPPEPLRAEDRQFLEDQRVARLATASPTGEPHLVPIVYCVLGDTLYFVVDDKPKPTRVGLKRLRNIGDNPRVAVLVDRYEEEWTRLRYLQVYGDAGLVTDADEYARALDQLRRRYRPYRDMAIHFDSHPMVRIAVRRCHRWRASTAAD